MEYLHGLRLSSNGIRCKRNCELFFSQLSRFERTKTSLAPMVPTFLLTAVCEAGARTAVPAQHRNRDREKRQRNRHGWHDGAGAIWRAFLFLSLAPELLSSVELRDSPEF